MHGVSRRTALCLLGTGLTLAAGCSSADETDGNGEEGITIEDSNPNSNDTDDSSTGTIERGDLPPYAQALADSPAETYFFGAVDLETMWTAFDGDGELSSGSDSGGGDAESGSEKTPTDPLVVNPLFVALIGYVVLLGLGFSMVGSVYNENDRDDGEGYVVFANDTNIIVSDYDFDGIVRDMDGLGYDEILLESDRAVYYDDATGLAIGVTASLFVYASEDETDDEFDPVEAVERHVNAAVGEQSLKHETDDDFEWLLRAGDTTGLVFCLFTDDDELDDGERSLEEDELQPTEAGDSSSDLDFDGRPYEGANGGLQHLNIVTDEDRPFASAVFTYASEDRVDVALLEESVGTQAEAESTTLVRDGATVRIEATYAAETIEE